MIIRVIVSQFMRFKTCVFDSRKFVYRYTHITNICHNSPSVVTLQSSRNSTVKRVQSPALKTNKLLALPPPIVAWDVGRQDVGRHATHHHFPVGSGV